MSTHDRSAIDSPAKSRPMSVNATLTMNRSRPAMKEATESTASTGPLRIRPAPRT
ncbi:hypothetical protein ACFQY7_48565 [Actinomadura luteofluorescens]|uniref:hypothetical protein n=1 Tax=Actinomadura luteofluorescens TaxID=46163 RepID=UPI0036439260